MVVLNNPPTEQLSLVNTFKPNGHTSSLFPIVDLSSPSAAEDIAKACEEFGFFKATNHGIPKELMARVEAEAVKFFSLPDDDKEKGGAALPFGYGNKRIGYQGDMGWVEYLLFEITSNPLLPSSLDFLNEPAATSLRFALNEYISAVKKLTCELLELMAEGLGIQPRNVLSKIVMMEESDRMFRINHYPACNQLQDLNSSLTGFGEHTDPQIISVLRSNNCNGFQIALKDGRWVPVQADKDSFFINVGDILQVLTNGRFRSVRHRVETNGSKSRVSMIYFGGPPPTEIITPLPQLLIKGSATGTETGTGTATATGIGEEERSRYKDFTWADYKKAAYNSKLAYNRLSLFEKI